MPRKPGGYPGWSSQTVLGLIGLLPAGTSIANLAPDFRNPGKKNAKGVELHTVDGGKGRPHREEAMLLQAVGEDNEIMCRKCERNEGAFLSCKSVDGVKRGACGNCLWDSKDIDCNLDSVREELEREVADKEQLKNLKERKAAVSGPVSSKRKRSKAVDLTDDGPEEQAVTKRKKPVPKKHRLRSGEKKTII